MSGTHNGVNPVSDRQDGRVGELLPDCLGDCSISWRFYLDSASPLAHSVHLSRLMGISRNQCFWQGVLTVDRSGGFVHEQKLVPLQDCPCHAETVSVRKHRHQMRFCSPYELLLAAGEVVASLADRVGQVLEDILVARFVLLG